MDPTILPPAAAFEFVRFLGRPVWTAQPEDADRFLANPRGLGRLTVQHKAWSLARFYEFLVFRYQGDIHAPHRCVVQPIDEFNRRRGHAGRGRVPPSDEEVDSLFTAWRGSVPQARKYLPAARDYFAASLWRRLGLRINETVMLDIRDWRPDLGEFGKLHVRFGKGSRRPRAQATAGAGDQRREPVDRLVAGRGPPPVRRRLGRPRRAAAPLRAVRPRPGPVRTGRRQRAAPRPGIQVDEWLPAWSGRLTPHVLRHYCASSLYAPGWTSRRSRSCSATSGCRRPRLPPRPQRPHRARVEQRERPHRSPPGPPYRLTRPRTTSEERIQMQWNLRLRAAERGIWKSAQLRRMLAEAGLEITAGKMSSWWAGTPTTIRLDDLDVICAVLAAPRPNC